MRLKDEDLKGIDFCINNLNDVTIEEFNDYEVFFPFRWATYYLCCL